MKSVASVKAPAERLSTTDVHYLGWQGCIYTILMEQLLHGNLLSVEHQSGHVIVVGVRSDSGAKVIPCLVSECRITLHGGGKCIHG